MSGRVPMCFASIAARCFFLYWSHPLASAERWRGFMNTDIATPQHDTTEDALFKGRVLLHQPKSGYRFSVDTPLLIWFASQSGRFLQCADLGAGSGAVGIGLLATDAVRHVVAIELQARLAQLCAQNAQRNGFGDKLVLIHDDMRQPHPDLSPKRFDLVVSNPPFWPADSGRLPALEERRIARHEIAVTLGDVVATASRLLQPGKGRFCIIFPARRLADLMAALHHQHLHATRMCFVYPRKDEPAAWVLLQARHGNSECLDVMPPLVLKTEDGRDTLEGAHILSGAFSPALMACADKRGLS